MSTSISVAEQREFSKLGRLVHLTGQLREAEHESRNLDEMLADLDARWVLSAPPDADVCTQPLAPSRFQEFCPGQGARLVGSRREGNGR